MVSQERVAVSLNRTEISLAAKLFAISMNPAIVEITNPTNPGLLSGQRTQNIEFKAIAEGRTPIEIRYNWPDGPVIGRLYVQVYSRIEIPIFIHLLGRVKTRSQPRRLLGKDCVNDRAAIVWIEELFAMANETWMPHGIVLTPSGATVGEIWGDQQITSNADPPTLHDILQAGMRSPNRLLNEVNVFVVPASNQSAAAAGVSTDYAVLTDYVEVLPLERPDPRTPDQTKRRVAANGLYLFSETPAPSETIPQTIAHEIGHYMSLCRVPYHGHSTGDLNVTGLATRDDLVSRRRLMYDEPVLEQSDFAWRNDTGYGTVNYPRVGVRGLAGSFISYRGFSKEQDITFGESARARETAAQPNFYAPEQTNLT